MKIAVVDYKMSNMFSIKNALDAVGLDSEITFDHKTILDADGAVLPGVGSFPEAMKNLKRLKIINSIEKFVSSNKPLMGICLGMQLLFDESEEINLTNGLGITSGKVIYFKRNSL